MSYIRQFSIDKSKHSKTIDHIDRWKKQGVNISEKICQLIDAEATKEEGAEQ